MNTIKHECMFLCCFECGYVYTSTYDVQRNIDDRDEQKGEKKLSRCRRELLNNDDWRNNDNNADDYED